MLREEQRLMQFMSPEHVTTMNALLEESADVRAAACELDRDYVLAYRLSDALDGRMEHWTMTLGPDGVRFALEPAAAPDLEVQAAYAEMIRSVQRARAGEPPETELTPVGDLAVLERIAPVYAVAQQVATVAVEFPEV